MYWAQAIAEQNDDAQLSVIFTAVARQLADNEAKIIKELNDVQGKSVDIGGYYRPDRELTANVMRPSPTLNAVIDGLQQA
jgi:isocitrate dehydrogenase